MRRVLDAIARHACEQPDALALVSRTQSYSYKQLAREIQTVAEALGEELGETGGCVSVALPNGPAWVILDLALVRLERASLPLPGFFTVEQTAHALQDAGAGWLIGSHGSGPSLRIGDAEIFLKRLEGDAARLPAGAAKVTYTSGSTGAPKGICLTQAQMEAVAQSVADAIGDEYAGVHMPLLPLSILLENVAGLYPMFLAGGCCRVEAPGDIGFANPFKPDFAVLGSAMAKARVTSLILVPELLRGLLAARWMGVLDCADLRYVAVGGAKVAPELLAAAQMAGLPVYEGYGLSECASVVAVNSPAASRSGSVGKPLSHVTVEIAGDGEIIIGPEARIAQTAQPSRTGKIHTGDIGHLDADGFLYVTGRKANRIITSFGRNVSPEWVESELLAEPQIRHAIVFGEACAELGALIAPTFDNLGREDIAFAVARANARLPEYARIGAFKVIPPLTAGGPFLTGNGRPRRAALLSAYSEFTATEGLKRA
jgi:long-chain acyl-CoA synthetase